MARKSVLVYKGTGASEIGCSYLLKALKASLDLSQHVVEFISAEDLIEGSYLEHASLVAFGAGYTSGFDHALGRRGMDNLRDFVLGGGSYLGLGAGGYFGCDYIEFDRGGPLEKFAERDLRFYPGIGIGPVYPGFKYKTNQGVNAAPITFNGNGLPYSSLHALIDGGCMFKPSPFVKDGSKVTATQSLAQFADLPGTPSAVVKTIVGEGHALLSGVHLEYDAVSLVDSDKSLEQFRESFVRSESKQRSAFKDMLKLLQLHVK